MRPPLFDLELAHGRCLGVRIPADPGELEELAAEALHPEELVHARTFALARRRTWIGGRVALRQALAAVGVACEGPVFADDRGAPRLPVGACASITHKEGVAAALVARADGRGRVGVDLEVETARKHDIARRVLTKGELAEIAALEGAAREREVLVRFSAKEAVYKALDPFVRRYVGFEEVAVTPLSGDDARVEAALRGGEGPFAFAATWRVFDGLVLTTARVAPR